MTDLTRRQLLGGSLAAAGMLALTPGLLGALEIPDELAAAFFGAIRSGDATRVAELLAREPALLHAFDPEGRTGFAVALLERRQAVAELLTERGYDTDLHEAALALDWPRFNELAETHPERVNRNHPVGGTAMYAAAYGGAGDQIWRVYAQMGEPNAVPEGALGPPLIAALSHPDVQTAERTAASLLGNGADATWTRPGFGSLLHLAAGRGAHDAVEMLIRKGAPIDARDEHGSTARESAERSGHRQVAELLGKHREIPRDHSTSRRAYDADGKPYRPPAMDGVPRPAESSAVGVSHRDLDALRQRVGATPALAHSVATTTEGAVEAGAHMGRQDIVDYLLAGGAPYSLPTAVMRGDEKRVRELLAEDPLRIHERGPHDFALLWYPVIGGGRIELAEILIAAGAEVERQHFLGTTALHYAALGGQLEMVAYLLQAGGDPGRIGKKFSPEGETPLELAEKRGHEKVAKLLRASAA